MDTATRPCHSVIFSRSRVLSAAITLTAIAGSATAQPGGDLWVGGLQHHALGEATLGPPQGRRLPVYNLGSSGQDGVEIRCPNSASVDCMLDLTEVSHTPGSQCKAAFQDLTFTQHGKYTAWGLGGGPGGGGGGLIQQFDFSAMNAVECRWVVRDCTGVVLAEGTQAGPVLSVETSSPSDSLIMNLRTRVNELESSLKHLGLLARCASGSMTVSGLTSTPIPNAASVECFPIICITSPCPGGWTGVSSVFVTASGVSTLSVADASRMVQVWPVNDAPVADSRVRCWGTNGLQIFDEPCAGLPENCPPGQATLRVSGWGDTGAELFTIDFSDQDTVEAAGGRKRDRVVRSASVDYAYVPALSSPPGENPGVVIEAQGRKWGNGHVTLMKLYDDEQQASGSRLIRCDASGLESNECVVSCLSSTGAVLASATLNAVTPISINNGIPSRLSMNATVARLTLDAPATCTLAGATVSGVTSVTFTPVNPKPAIGIDALTCGGKHIDHATFKPRYADPSIMFAGFAHNPIGSVGHYKSTAGTLRFTDLDPNGQEGCEIVCGGPFGASCDVALSDILAQPGTNLRTKYKGWDGTIKGRLQCTSTSANSIACIQDFSTTGATSMHWQAVDRNGAVLAEGDHPSALLDFACVLLPNPGLPPTSMSLRTSGYDLKKAKKRSETACVNGLCRLTIPGRPPINGVAAIRCDVYPPASMLKHLEGTQSILVTSSAPALEVSNAAACSWSFGSSNPSGLGGVGAATGVGQAILLSECTIPVIAPPQIVASNIGSSGQDGVLIQKFQNGDIPDGQDFTVRAGRAPGWTLDGATATFATVNDGGMALSYHADPVFYGHVTLMKFEVHHDPYSPVSAETVACDAAGRGALSVMCTFSDGSGVALGSAELGPADRLSVPVCALHMHQYGTRADGTGHIEVECDSTVVTSTGLAFTGVRAMTFTPIAPSIPPMLPEGCLVTGTSLDALIVEDMQIATPACPADLGRQGGLLGGDGHYDNNDFVAFIDLFFNGSSGADLGKQGGIPGADGRLDNNDFIIFIDMFFQGCP